MRNRGLVQTIVLVVMLGVAACGGLPEEAGDRSGRGGRVLEAAVDDCGLSSSPYVVVDEAGLFIDGRGEESPGATVEEIACVLFVLDTPGSVISRIDATNSLMGVQEASFRGLKMAWTYHPNNGLDISIVEE